MVTRLRLWCYADVQVQGERLVMAEVEMHPEAASRGEHTGTAEERGAFESR